MHAGITLLHAPVVAAADQLAGFAEECSADRDAALDKAMPRLSKSDGKHLLVEFLHRTTVIQRVSKLASWRVGEKAGQHTDFSTC
jgi:hypothetical protein